MVWPGEELTSRLPSIRSASCRAIDRPRPEPWPASPLWKRSNTFGSCSGGMPRPSSVTVSSTVGRPFLSAWATVCLDHHRRALAGVRESVVQQRSQDLCHAHEVGLCFDVVLGVHLRDVDMRALHGGCGGELGRDLVCQRQQWHGLQLHLQRSGIQAREVEQIGCQLLEPSHLLAHRGQELRSGRLVYVLVHEQLHEASEREDRSAQLVGGIGDELLAGLVEARQLALHLVERTRQLAQLVLGVDRDRVGEVSCRHLARSLLETLEPFRERVGRVVAADQRDQQGDASCDQDLALDQRDVVGHVAERGGKDDHPGGLALVVEGLRDLGQSLASLRASRRRHLALACGGEHGARGGLEASDRLARVRDHVGRRRLATGAALVARYPEQRHAGAGLLADTACELVQLGPEYVTADRALERLRVGGGVLAQPLQLLGGEARLQLRHDVEVDDHDRARGDREEHQREPVLDRGEGAGALSLVAEPIADAAHGQQVLGGLRDRARSSRAGGVCGRRSCAGRDRRCHPRRGRAARRAGRPGRGGAPGSRAPRTPQR